LTLGNTVWIAVTESGNVGRAPLACEAARRKPVKSGDGSSFRPRMRRQVARLSPLSNEWPDGDNMICAYHALNLASTANA